jgi:catechol-2,3-dioxygenase
MHEFRVTVPEEDAMLRTVDAAKAVQPTKFAHFVVRARDLDASVAWYEKVLGMRIQHRNEAIAFMTYDDEHHRVAIAKAPNEDDVPRGAPGVDHVAYTLASLEDLLCLYKRLKSEGISPVWPINHGLTTSIYYEDPDGVRIEFQVENFPTKEELNGYMTSTAFAENPIGVTFDPERLIERYENGDSLEELVTLESAS